MHKHGRTGPPITADPNRLRLLDRMNLEAVQATAFPNDATDLTPAAAVSMALYVTRAVINAGELQRFLPGHLARLPSTP